MQIVIDIPDDEIEYIKNTSFVEHESTVFKQSESDRKKTMMIFNLLDAIRDGTPLPKGHGRLGDLDGLIEDIKIERLNLYMEGLKGTPRGYEYLNEMEDKINDAPTIIEADKAESEDKE